MSKWLFNELLCLIERISFLSTVSTETKIKLCLHSSSKESICHLLISSANCLLLNFILIFFFWTKLSPHYRIKRSSDRGILSSLYAVNLIIITVIHLDTRSLQSSVSARELRDSFSILHTAHYKGTDLNNTKFLCSVKTFLRSSISTVLI